MFTLRRVAPPFVFSFLVLGLAVAAPIACTSGDFVARPLVDGSAGDANNVETDVPEAGPLPNCAKLRMLEVRPSTALGLYFSADDCQGAPLTALDETSFEVLEDDKPITVGSTVALARQAGQEAILDLVLDLSVQTESYRTQVFAAARALLDSVKRSPTRFRVGIRAYNGVIVEVQAPTLDWALLDAPLDGSYELSRDVAAADLYGSVAASVRRLADEGRAVRDRSSGGAFSPKHVVLISGGVDTAKRSSAMQVATEAEKEGASVYALVPRTANLDADAEARLRQVAAQGTRIVGSPAELEAEAQKLGETIKEQLKRNYTLVYCTTTRAGAHQVSVRLKGPWTTERAAQGSFGVTSLGACDAKEVANCGGHACGGLACGGCDERTDRCDNQPGEPLRRCVNACALRRLCAGEDFFNGVYTQKCSATPSNMPCNGNCVDTTRDPANCGVCGLDCGRSDAKCMGATPACSCPGGTCPTLVASDSSRIIGVTGNGTLVAGLGGLLETRPAMGGAATPLVSIAHGQVIIAENDAVVVSSFDALYRVPVATGTPILLGQVASGQDIKGIAVQGANFVVGAGSRVYNIPRTGGAASVVVSDAFGYNEVSQVAATPTSIAWVQAASFGTVLRYLRGGAPVDLRVLNATVQLLAAGESIFFRDGANLYRADLSAATVNAVLMSNNVVDLGAADATSVYGFEPAGLFRQPAAGGAPTLVAPNTSGAVGAVDATHVYWENYSRLFRIRK